MIATLAAASNSTGTGETVTFWVLAPLMVLASLGMLVVRKAVHSALLLAVTMVSLAVLYIAQDAPFLGIVQIVVYASAVMMLFLFVLMLVGVDSSDSLVETLRGQRVATVVLGIGLAALLLGVIGHTSYSSNTGLVDANAGGNVEGIARLLFTRYVFAFEVTSALLITAALGAMVLTHRERLEPRKSQRELSEQRVRAMKHLPPLPSPGIYARHNAVDTPALLPDGSPSDLSLFSSLQARGTVRDIAPYVEDLAEIDAQAQDPSGREALETRTGHDGPEGTNP